MFGSFNKDNTDNIKADYKRIILTLLTIALLMFYCVCLAETRVIKKLIIIVNEGWTCNAYVIPSLISI